MSHRILKDLAEAFALSGPGYVPLTANAIGVKIPNDRLLQIVIPTWVSSANVLVLPAAKAGTTVVIAAAATGGVLQTGDVANVTVNGNTQLTIPPDQTIVAVCESDTSWKAISLDGAGDVAGLGSTGAAKVFKGRFTAAQINAGVTALPAVPGMKYRLQDMAMIAEGGNAGGTTGVRLRGTQTTEVTLFDCKVAGLTQNTLLRAGTATNGLILAAGASFNPCDANTAITVIKDGNNLTTATHIHVLLTYTLVPA